MGASERIFCWWPTPVYSHGYYRDGFAWLRFAWRAPDGRVFRVQGAAP